MLFHVHKFTTNLRLRSIIGNDDYRNRYNKMLMEVGKGLPDTETILISEDTETSQQLIRIPILTFVHDKSDVISFLYPNGFDPNTMHTKCILASK